MRRTILFLALALSAGLASAHNHTAAHRKATAEHNAQSRLQDRNDDLCSDVGKKSLLYYGAKMEGFNLPLPKTGEVLPAVDGLLHWAAFYGKHMATSRKDAYSVGYAKCMGNVDKVREAYRRGVQLDEIELR